MNNKDAYIILHDMANRHVLGMRNEEREALTAALVSLSDFKAMKAERGKLKIARWLTLLQDIVACAGSNPQGLTSFNSPILQRAVQEIFLHNNPEAEDDEQARQRQIWLELSQAQKCPLIAYQPGPPGPLGAAGTRDCAGPFKP